MGDHAMSARGGQGWHSGAQSRLPLDNVSSDRRGNLGHPLRTHAQAPLLAPLTHAAPPTLLARGLRLRLRPSCLAEEIAILAAHIHAATHRFLVLVAEFDRLRGWKMPVTTPAP
jgi:hypothetical protein